MKKLLEARRCGLTPWRLAAMATITWLASGAPGPAEAQQGLGVRAGVGADPDQFYVGGHYVTAPLVDRLRFQPNVEVGIGDDLTLVAFNVEFGYWTRLNRDWQIYAGGGPALNLYDSDRFDETEAEPGFNLLVGFQQRKGLFFEFKVGLIDSPEIKLGVGYTFR
jgi:hypothetical protein